MHFSFLDYNRKLDTNSKLQKLSPSRGGKCWVLTALSSTRMLKSLSETCRFHSARCLCGLVGAHLGQQPSAAQPALLLTTSLVFSHCNYLQMISLVAKGTTTLKVSPRSYPLVGVLVVVHYVRRFPCEQHYAGCLFDSTCSFCVIL